MIGNSLGWLLSIFVEFGTSLSFSPDGLPIKNQDKNREFLDMKLQSLFHEEDSWSGNDPDRAGSRK